MDSKVSKSVSKLVALRDEINEQCEEREELTMAIMLALVTKQHCFIYGTPGTAKSFVASAFMDGLVNTKKFSIQLTGGATEDDVFGPIRIKKWKEQEVREFNLTGRLAEAEVAYLEEFFDATEVTLRSMNEVTDEGRKFTRSGAKIINCPLHSMFATSNAWKAEGQYAAVANRFLMRIQVNPLVESESRISMMAKYTARLKAGSKWIPATKVSLADLILINSAILSTDISRENLELVDEVLNIYKQERGKAHDVTDRRQNWVLPIIMASALIDGRDYVSPEDIEKMKYGICFVGRDKDEEVFNMAIGKAIGDIEERKRLRKHLDKWKTGIKKARAILSTAEPSELVNLHQKMTEALLGLPQREKSKDPGVEAEFVQVGKDVEALVEQIRDAIPEDQITDLS